MTVILHDPDAIVDYTIDWDDGYLQSDSPAETIATSAWSVDPDDSPAPAIDSDTNTDTTATVFVLGGARGFTHRLTNRITTSRDRTDERSIVILVEHR